MFEIGDVLKVEWDERPIRVIIADPIEVFYDVFWQEDIGWGLARSRTAIYGRITTDFLAKSATKIRSEPLTPKESSKHRPDLPMRLFRSGKANWFDNRLPPEVAKSICIKASQLALIPFGAKGAQLRALKVHSSNGSFFSGEELLTAAHDGQDAICPDVSGIPHLGHNSRRYPTHRNLSALYRALDNRLRHFHSIWIQKLYRDKNARES